ncbi:BA75_01055T0 [Komagataella pastoris]|uniref:BA75_01055T0 n=1 Tax=Komagataella pastoris TaxID=4922 RepID=A0A1B2J5A0_PICPA|nr:BA75_01055T0 [Komagataella pastoris]
MSLQLPCLTLRPDIKSELYSQQNYLCTYTQAGESLWIRNRDVVWMKGNIIYRRLNFESDESIITTLFCCFNGENRCLVVVFREQASIFYEDGRMNVISFPFNVRNAFCFEQGIILEKLQDLAADNEDSSRNVRFLTMTDALADYGAAVSSSTSTIGVEEELCSFSESQSSSNLCCTFDKLNDSIHIYHIKYLIRKENSRSSSASGNAHVKRRIKQKPFTVSSTPNSSKLVDEKDVSAKKRINSLSQVLSIDRMASGPDTGDFHSHTHNTSVLSSTGQALRKDIILTRVYTFSFNDTKENLNIFPIKCDRQEAVVIHNRRTCELCVVILNYDQDSLSLPSFSSIHRLSALDSKRISNRKNEFNTSHDGYIIILKDESTLFLANPFFDLLSPPINLKNKVPPISRITSTFEECIAMMAKNNKIYEINLVLHPQNKLVDKLLSMMKYCGGDYTFEYVWLKWCCLLELDPSHDEWTCILTTLLSVIFPNDLKFQCLDGSNELTSCLPLLKKFRLLVDDSKYQLSDLSPILILSVHLLREDLKLDIMCSQQVDMLGVVLAQLTQWASWTDSWICYYQQSDDNVDKSIRLMIPQLFSKPPNIVESLSSIFTDAIVPYITFSQLVEEPDYIDELMTPRTFHVLKLFEAIISSDFSEGDVISMMLDYQISSRDLETYPMGVYFPLRSIMAKCKEEHSPAMSTQELAVVGRKDLQLLLADMPFQQLLHFHQRSASFQCSRDVHQILQALNEHEVLTAWDGQLEADRMHTTRRIFSEDRRFHEITRLLQSSKVQPALLNSVAKVNEHDLHILQKHLALTVALRTLTIPLGRSAIFISSRRPLITERFPIPKLNFQCVLLPQEITTTLEKSAIDSETIEWGYFHNGVSAGLTVSRDATEISGSWIVFNRPPKLNAQHAGFLYGLGLNGHMKKLEEWHIYNYLGPKHLYTSVGLLLGMSASLKGTKDLKLTKVLSVHIVALLPAGSTDLNVSLSVQASGLIGIGLLYLKTQHRRMSEMLLSQIKGSLMVDERELVSETYRLSAGIAFGLINLGKGDKLGGLNDTHHLDTLFSLACGSRDTQTKLQLDKSSAGAIMAIIFIFLRTNLGDIANRLDVPDAEQLLDYIRPEFLLLRVLGKQIILWDSIECSLQWVSDQVPKSINLKATELIEDLNSDCLKYLYTVTGLCMSISLRFASTSDEGARDTLLWYFDQFMRLTSLSCVTHDNKITLKSVMELRDLLGISLSIIMAGSGDLKIMRRLRYLQNDTNFCKYGNFMAINMALGFLFLGGGQYAFKNDMFSIATLLISIYPVFPKVANDGEDVLLQALRHFWSMAVEKRCLIVRDAETSETLSLMIHVVLKNGSSKKFLSPCLLPDFNDIDSIIVNDDGYFSIKMDMEALNEKFKKSPTIFVLKKRFHNSLKRDLNEVIMFDGNIHHYQKNQDLSQLALNSFKAHFGLLKHEREALLNNNYEFLSNAIDFKLEILQKSKHPKDVEDYWNLKLVFQFSERQHHLHYMNLNFLEQLKDELYHTYGI